MFMQNIQNLETIVEDHHSCDSIGSCDTMDEPQRVTLYGHGKINYKYKIKTEICRYWSEEGYCQFGDNCAFAHGKIEVRDKIHLPINYKTKQCKNYIDFGVCIYGERCQFLHPSKQISKLPQLPYQSLNQDIEALFKSGGLRTRLHCFQNF